MKQFNINIVEYTFDDDEVNIKELEYSRNMYRPVSSDIIVSEDTIDQLIEHKLYYMDFFDCIYCYVYNNKLFTVNHGATTNTLRDIDREVHQLHKDGLDYKTIFEILTL